MAAPKGNKFSPGRPKGSKDKIPRKVKESILDVWDKLEREEKGLYETAKADPPWFYANFVKPMIPKEVDATIDAGEAFTEILRKIIK